ncbi:MAG: PIN domain-containing protein [Alphaproteobacteria bacterium]
MALFTILCDACVLYPAPLRDLLIELAGANLYQAKWTDRIHDEWMSNLLRNRRDLTQAQLSRTRDLMNRAVLDCLIDGYEHLLPVIRLPDDNDRHVVAAAIHARADAIVTFNLKDFPRETLREFQLDAIHPDDFIRFQIDLDEAAVVTAAQKCHRRLRNPPISAMEYLDVLQRQSLPKAAAALRSYASIL